MNNTQIAIETHHLTRKFGPLVAVDDLNLSIARGEIFGFLGPNGAGKSTTIRMLCGILRPSQGTGTVGGYDIVKQPEQIKRVIGYMSQSFGLYNDLTVEENLAFYSRIYLRDWKQAKQKREAVIEAMGFGEYRNQLSARLSGGWKQRLALACAVVHEPQILFLDEPTAGIDPVSRRVLWDILYELSKSKGITLFVTTHYMEEAERCNKIGFIWRGRLVACDSPANVKGRIMTDELLNLKCSDIHHAFETLLKSGEIIDVNIYGDELHIVVPSAAQGAETVRRLMAEARVEVYLLEPIPASIEDVFVSLSRKN
ncbi:MAG: ABC transporter ATP-binding protein [Candidatus Lindowbacteria bacterium]|nr:ABC transporter ATP-binding protein [Candidatus Lindowbacteria bacterium]